MHTHTTDLLSGPWIFTCPFVGPYRWILYREVVKQRVSVRHFEAFFDAHVTCSRKHRWSIVEIGCLDDESVTVPPTNRITHPSSHIFRQVFGVHSDDSGIVNHLNENNDCVGALNDSFQIVVQGEHHRGSTCRRESLQTPIRECQRFGVIVWSRSVTPFHPIRLTLVLSEATIERTQSVSCLVRQCRTTSILWVVHNGSPDFAV